MIWKGDGGEEREVEAVEEEEEGRRDNDRKRENIKEELQVGGNFYFL